MPSLVDDPANGHLGSDQSRHRRRAPTRTITRGSATTTSSGDGGLVHLRDGRSCRAPARGARVRRMRLHRYARVAQSRQQRRSLAVFLLPWGPDFIPHPGSMIRLDDLEAIGAFDRSTAIRDGSGCVSHAARSRGRFVWTRRSVSRDSAGTQTPSRCRTVLASSREAEAVKRRHRPRRPPLA